VQTLSGDGHATLTLKLVRDLGGMKGQMTAIAWSWPAADDDDQARGLVVSLETARTDYTPRIGSPMSLRSQAGAECASFPSATIADVAAVETRVKGSAVLDVPGMSEPADGIMLSLPDDRPQQFNRLFLRSGSGFRKR
jgi:putative ABC transport system permease protein